MANTDFNLSGVREPRVPLARINSKMLHRIAEVRKRQGISLRSVARRSGLPIRELRRQETADTDLRLSELYIWQDVLGVPISELFVEPKSALSPPVLRRAQFVRLMKTVKSIVEESQVNVVRRLAERMMTQLIDLMPELKDVGAWHSVGSRRTLDELGRTAERSHCADLLNSHGRFG